MKILLLNTCYKTGSTGKIIDALASELQTLGHEVVVGYGIGDANYDNYSVKICSTVEHKINAILARITGIQFGGLFYSNYKVEKIIESFHPDIVHIHCINGSIINVYLLLKYLAKNKIKTVISLHAEIFHTAGCSHAYDCNKWMTKCQDCARYKQAVTSWFFDRSIAAWNKMYSAINSFDRNDLLITAVSPWLLERVKKSSIMRMYKSVYVPNGVDTNIFHYVKDSKFKTDNHFKYTLIFVSPSFTLDINDQKGGRYLPEIAKRLPDCRFIVVANYINCKKKQLPTNIQIWGKAKNQQELSELYSSADISLVLSERETFSMVTAESLCCGTPVIGFEAGGPESIAIPDYSKFVKYGDVDALVQCISKFECKYTEKSEMSKISKETYSKKSMTDKYINCFELFK